MALHNVLSHVSLSHVYHFGKMPALILPSIHKTYLLYDPADFSCPFLKIDISFSSISLIHRNARILPYVWIQGKFTGKELFYVLSQKILENFLYLNYFLIALNYFICIRSSGSKPNIHRNNTDL